jgi:rhamnogalacturonan endolyase
MTFFNFKAAAAALVCMVGVASAAVTLTEDDTTYTLDNGIVRALVSKNSGDLISMQYKGMEMLATVMGPDGRPDLKVDPTGHNVRGFAPFTDHQYGFWSHDASSTNTVSKVTIDPAANSGTRAEVSIKGLSNGKPMGAGPGGGFISDIEIRYALGSGDSGVYTYSIFEHHPDYPDSSLGEARFCAKLNNVFDWMLVDQHHNFLYPQSQERGDNKYNYTSVQFDHPAFGWASTTKNVGLFFVNASVEYLTGPPTKVEFLCHRDTNQVAAPCVLNYWRSSHYGGASVDVAKGEHWTKVIGPFLIYCNSGHDPQAIWKDAIAQVGRESAKWPYDWVSGVDYPQRDQRGTVTGTLALNDPIMADAKMSRLMVGLAAPDYTIPTDRPAATNSPRDVEWQTDAKHYEFWVHGDDDGTFSIPNVRPGTYTLHAFADGVLGEYAKTDIVVQPGKSLDLGSLTWQPVRHGRQVWDIGIPNRNGSEFAKGDDYFHDGMGLVYAKMFPNDVNYVIGKSDYHTDWFYEQVPHATSTPATRPAVVLTTRPAGRGFGRGGAAMGRATPWTITFDLADAPHGTATLRLAIATCNTHEIDVTVNGKPAGPIDHLSTDSAIGRNGIQGIWYEREFPFDAAMLKSGTNTMTLTVPAGGLTAGVIYDYLRLELN